MTWEEWESSLCPEPACKQARYLPRELLITEVEHLLGTDSPEHIAARLGLSTPWLHTRLTRTGRSDLARHFPQYERRAA